ncbi:MAG TPA: hypothetical protein VH234_05420 [Candidatus Saccharimonadales bacterium]|jgi:hypothetical protein|nr:hypothetical protein [Candidatus Saccharimonadales bacterium]
MSGSGGLGGGSAVGATTIATGAVALPFTGGNTVVSYIIITAMICGAAIVLSKLAKTVAGRFLA